MFCWILAVKCLTVFSSICIVLLSDAGWSSMVARRAHNPKVVGSNPAPATKFSNPRFYRGFFLGLMTGISESLYLKKVVWNLDVRVFRWLLFSIIFVDRVHATALVLSTNFVAWALPANHSRFQVTCPFIIFVGRTHATDIPHQRKSIRSPNIKGRLKPTSGFQTTFLRQSFSWTESTLRHLCCQQTL